ncbi:MAG: choice-of-anchor Q domain-containing protein, partial [Anaerolineae bacterium]
STPTREVIANNTPIPTLRKAQGEATETADLPTTAASTPACAQGGGIVQNGGFDSDVSDWEKPYGRLLHTTSEYNSAPGAAQLVTSHSSDSLEQLGTFGQCIDLGAQLEGWPEVDGREQALVEVYLKTDANIVSASLNVIFLSGGRCTGEHVGQLYPGPVAGGQDWTRVSGTMAVPDTAKSLHVFVWATGVDDSGTVYVDDIQACPSEPAAATGTGIPPTATPIPGTAAPILPTATPLPASGTVCGAGCDFTKIQAAIDDPATADGAILEVLDAVHTEAGIVVSKDVTIRGLGAENTVVQAHETLDGAQERVLLVPADTMVVLEKMTIRHGKPNEDNCGGGILSEGALTLRACIVSSNMANGGGGVCSRGGEAALTVINSTVKDNIAGATVANSLACGNGAGIRTGSGTLVLVNSTVTGNSTESGRGRGGGIHIGCGGTAVFTNTTISANTARPQSDNAVSRKQQGHGGGINLHGTLRLVNCTISDNHGIGPGGGVYVRGHLDFVNTIIAHNGGKGGECVVSGPDAYGISGSLGTNSHNLVADGTCDPAYDDDPVLGPLADNGGDTLTHALLPDSPAIDVVPAISCTVPTDQRGALRPMVQSSPETPCDTGAFEVQTEPLASSTPEAFLSGGTIISADTVDQVERFHTLEGHRDRVLHLTFSGTGAYVASSSRDKTIRVWDVRSGQEEHAFSMDDVDMSHIAFSPDGSLLASAGAVWDMESMQVRHRLERGREIPGPVAFSPDGSLLAVALINQPIRLWDVTSGQVARTFEEQTDSVPSMDGVVFNIAFSPDGALLAAGGLHGTVRLWDVERGQIAGTLEYGNESGLHDVAFSPDGSVLASGGTDPVVRLWDVVSGQVVDTLSLRDGLFGVAFSPDGTLLATAGGDERAVLLWDVQSRQVLRTLPHDDQLMDVTFSPDGSLLASGGYDNLVYLWGIR